MKIEHDAVQHILCDKLFTLSVADKTHHYGNKSFVLNSITPCSNIFLQSILITKRHDKCLRWYKWTQWLTFNYNKALCWIINGW